MNAAALQRTLHAAQNHLLAVSRRKIDTYFPDTGWLRRELYPKHMQFFALGVDHRERCLLAANRIGKTESVGGYELTLHLTGQYPTWWIGRRFDRPIRAWACGDTGKTVREILQRKLLGPITQIGTGLIPADSIIDYKRGSGVADAIEVVTVKHEKGGASELVFKSYDQGRIAYQGTEQDVILLDEEPPLAVYTECLLRTMTNNGMILATFTPLLGISDVVQMFLAVDADRPSSRALVTATWDDVPHLSESVKKELLASIPEYQRAARSTGVPYLGAGAIYQVPEADITVPDFEIPVHWPRAYALDVGWNRTAALWGARDLETDTVYLYSEHYRAHAEPVVHAQAIKARGEWIKGVIDPAANGRGQIDGRQLMALYEKNGLHLDLADNSVEAGIYATWERLSSGRLKVLASLGNWLAEYRIYRRDEKGKIIKDKDHLMDDTRYLVQSGIDVMSVKPVPKKNAREADCQPQGWMG